MGWPSVRKYKDGDKVNADTLNDPINQLTERTEQLYRLLRDHDRTKVVVSASLSLPDGFGDAYVGMPVYRTASGAYAPASAMEQQNAWFYAADAAMAVGVVSKVSDGDAEVVLYGEIDLEGAGVSPSDIIADDVRESGRYYLSAEAGKLTAHPNGPVIYVCNVTVATPKDADPYVSSILVSPQYRDTGESHVHRQVVLRGFPAGGTVREVDGKYVAGGIASQSGTAVLSTYGHWDGSDPITYVVTVREDTLSWTSDDATGDSGSTPLRADGPTAVGKHGLSVRVTGDGVWELAMPDAARGWANYSEKVSGTLTQVGYALNLQMYLHLDGSYVDPNPLNGAYVSVDGIELRGPVFGARRQWKVVSSLGDESGNEGPWLIWYGCTVDGDNAVAPFLLKDGVVVERDILFTTNTMRVGPTGFVTSLQSAPGSILRFTRAGTSFPAAQGPLMASLGIDFRTEAGGVRGHEVVKRIVGETFYTGPVVEKIVAGPGVSAIERSGAVTVSVSNAAYAGDFETIALKNAKQDLVGNVFPYTKLLGWRTGAVNVNSGFSAKFRVPDHIPYGKYGVIVSASVFGEEQAAQACGAAFLMSAFYLRDYALSSAGVQEGDASTDVSQPTPAASRVIEVPFDSGHPAFDPVVIHGFAEYPDVPAQRTYIPDLMLKKADGSPVVVYPGYFIGVDISRTSSSANVGYEAAIGFLSLRWNLVSVEG